jgi:hypothetical protein
VVSSFDLYPLALRDALLIFFEETRVKRLIFLVMALYLPLVAREASAQVFVSPFVGWTLSSPTPHGKSSRAGYGVSFGVTGKIVGFDTEVAYFPEVINSNANSIAKNKVVTFSADTLIGPTIGAWKPYGAIGAGSLWLNIDSLQSAVLPNPTSFSSNYFAFNAGAGVIGYFSNHFGLRGDVRYFKAYGFDISTSQTNGALSLNHFDFWRGTIGLAIKF